MPKHGKAINISKFRGIENKSLPENTSPEFFKKAINIDITKNGDVIKRGGFTKKYNGNGLHSLFSDGVDCYFVENKTLKYLNNNFSSVSIDSNLGDNKVDYLKLNGKIYYTSVSGNGIIENKQRRNFGIEAPAQSPTLSEGVGNLYEGQYQISISYVDDEGLESGSRLASTINVSNDSSIIITNLPTSPDPNVEYVRVYMSVVNGEQLYIAHDVPNGTTSTIIYNERDLVTPNETLGIDVPPLGDLISYYNGRILIAQNNVLWWSEPFSYTWFNLQKNFYQFESNIQMIIPMESGIYIGLEERVVWMAGNDVEDFSLIEKEICHPIKYTNIEIPSGYIRIDNTPLGPKWLFTADEGMYVCMENGVMFNVTSSNVSFPDAESGAGLFMKHNGVDKYISLLKNKNSDSQNMAVGDLVTAEVIRNGVVIP